MSRTKVAIVSILLLLFALPVFAAAQRNNLPVIKTLSPTATTAGTAVLLTVSGSNFSSGSQVLWNGVAQPTTIVNSTTLRISVTSAMVSAAGTAKVSVFSAGRFGGSSATLSFTINPAAVPPPPTGTQSTTPLAITTASIPIGTTGTAYSATLAASGGTPPYSWSVGSGALPPGLTMSSAGAISGTPTTNGSFSFMATVKDAGTSTPQSFTYSTSIAQGAPPLSVSTASVPSGTVGIAYSATLAATSGTFPYSWSVISGALPAGLTLSSAGAIAGTPSAGGSFTFTAQVKDSASGSATQSYSVSIGVPVPPLVISIASVPGGTAGTAYPATTLAATGGVSPYSWSISAGALPAGLTLSSAGAIAGTPSVGGSFTFTAQVKDSASGSATQSYSVSIGVPVPPLVISTASVPGATAGTAYPATTLGATGGTSPYSWSISAGALPAGLTLSSAGAITGTPTASGPFSFTAQAKDSASGSATQSYSMTIAAGLSVTTNSVPNGTAGTAYSTTLAATGGTSPYTWSVSTGTLPAGLTLSSAGAITGTPTASGPSTFTAQVKDSASGSATQSYSMTIGAALAITTASVPGGTAGTAYPATTLAATGGSSPYTWSVASGSTLPVGLTLSSAGTISGTPTTAGPYTFSIQANDSVSNTLTQNYSMTVAAAAVGIVWQSSMEASDPRWDFVNTAGDVAINTNPAFVHSGGQSLQVHHGLCGDPNKPPSLGQVAGGTLAQQAVFIKYAYTNANGQTNSSKEATLTVAAGNVFAMASPPPSLMMTGYNVYAGAASGAEVLQNRSPIPIGTDWTEDAVAGLVTGTAASPTGNTAGCGAANQDTNRWVSKVITPGLTDAFARAFVYFKSPEADAKTGTVIQRKILQFSDSLSSGNITGNYEPLLTSWTGSGGLPTPTINLAVFVGGSTACGTGSWEKDGIAPLNWDTWYEVEMEVKLNTPGASDGAVNVWVNGALVYTNPATNPRGKCTSTISNFSFGRQVNRYNMEVVNEYRYLDDIVVGGSYIP